MDDLFGPSAAARKQPEDGTEIHADRTALRCRAVQIALFVKGDFGIRILAIVATLEAIENLLGPATGISRQTEDRTAGGLETLARRTTVRSCAIEVPVRVEG